MRVRQNVHFEILGQRGGGWTVLGIQHTEKQAIKEAREQRRAGRTMITQGVVAKLPG